jgi:hypothetical protein
MAAQTNTNVGITILSTFKDKGTKEAATALGGLSSAAKKLGGVLGAVATISFGKKMLDAFAADDKAAKALAQTLTNLGQAYAVGSTAKFIQQLQDTTGVLDDELRPAFTTLVNSTLDAKKAQDLLALSLDVSYGTTQDLATVSKALAKASIGEKGALVKLGIGLSSAQLATMNLADITQFLTNKFGGQAATAADTYAGKMAILKAKASDAAETIGGSLAKALDDAFGNPQQIGSGIDTIASKIAGLVEGIGKFIKVTKTGLQNPTLSPSSPLFNYKLNAGKAYDPRSGNLPYEALTADEKRRKAEALKLQKEQLRLQQETLKKQKEAAQLAKAKGILDVQQAGIVAALQGKISDNEKLRLELQLALLTGNAKEADRLSNELLISQAQTTGLASFISNLPKALNPFSDYPMYVLQALAELEKLKNAQTMVTFQGVTAAYGTPIAYQGGYQTNASVTNVNIAGSLVTEKEIADFVRLELINQSGGGNFSTLNRNDFRL